MNDNNEMTVYELEQILADLKQELDDKMRKADEASSSPRAPESYCVDMRGYARGISHAANLVMDRFNDFLSARRK